MKLKTTPSKILLLLLSFLSSGVCAQVALSGMTAEPKNYKKFSYPQTNKAGEAEAGNRGYEHHPEFGVLFADAPSTDCFEAIGKRTEKTKTFIKNGTGGTGLFIQSSTDAMHIKDAGGNWVTIRTDLMPGSREGIYEATQQIDPLIVDTKEGYIKIGHEGMSLTYNRALELLYIKNDGTVTSLGKADWTRHTAGKDGVYVTDAWPGIDIEINTLRGAAKTNFIINNAMPQFADGKMMFRDNIKMDDGMSLYAEGKETYSGNLEVQNANGHKLFDITQAVAFEKEKVKETLEFLNFHINGNVLDIEVPGSLLNRPSTSYPVVIDPYVQATNSVTVPGSTYSAGWTVGCTVVNPVPIPAGMNINAVTWSFNYQAVSGAWMSEGATDFIINGCRSPNLSNYYWYCNVNSGGTCSGNNISIYNDVSSCLLPPQCAYTQNVSMNLYRRFGTGAACGAQYIIAATPFVATISGNTLDPGTVTASVGTVNNPVCAGGNVNLTSTPAYGTQPYTYVWLPGNQTTASITVNPTTTTTYTVNITDACGSTATQTVTVYVTALPPPPTVNSPVNVCQNSTMPNLSTYVTGSSIKWYTSSTGGVGSTTPPTISTSTVTSFTYYVSQTVNGCESTRTPIVINITAQPSPPTVTTPVSLCQNSTAPSITTYVTSGTGLLWYTTSTGGTGSSTPPNINTSVAGTTVHYVSQTANGCESQRAAISVIIIAQPSPPSVVTPVTYCQFATATALSATGQNLLWYTSQTGGTGTNTAPVPNTSTAGTTTYYVSQTVNGCESQRAAVVVNIIAKPAPPVVVTPVTFCQFQPATPLGNNVTGTNILWYTTQTGGTGSTTAPTVNTSVVSTTDYYVSQTVNGCESDRELITVIVAGQPGIPTVVSPVVYCQFDVPAPLSSSVTGTNLLWYTQQTGGVGNSADPVINTSVPGSTTYYVSQSVGTCEGPRTSIVVTIKAKPSMPVVTTPVVYCESAQAVALTAMGQNLLWYTTQTGGTGSTTAIVPSTTAAGSTDYYVSQTVNGCESDRAVITVNVISKPFAPQVVSPVTYCQFETAQPLQNSVTGTNLQWYTSSTGGSPIAMPVVNTTVTSNNTYYVSQTVNGCESDRSAIQVVVGPSPQPPAVVSPLVYCQNQTTAPLDNSVTGINLMWYTTLTGGTGSATAPTIDSSVAGTVHFYVSQGLGNCESQRSDIEVIINPTPSSPVVVSPVELCQYDTVFLTAQGQGLLWYDVPTGGTGAATQMVASQSAGSLTYYVSQTVNGCESPRASVSVVVKPRPFPPSGASVYSYCQYAAGATQLSASGNNVQWYDDQGNPITAPTPNTNIPGVFTYYATQTDNGCESERLEITVTINVSPGLPVVEQVTVCQGEPVPALTAQGQNLQWYNSATGGTGTTTAPVPNTADTGVTDYYVSQTVNGCEGGRSLLRVTVNPKVEAMFTIDKDTLCDSYPLTVTFTGTAPTTANFDWGFDGASQVTGSGAGPYTVIWSTEGIKTITLSVSNLNCSSSASGTVVVLPTPDPSFTLQPDACVGEEVRVKVAWDQLEMPGYAWDFGGAQVLEGTGAGPYTLKWNTPGSKVVSLSLTNIPCPSLPYSDTIHIHRPSAKIESVSVNDICTADSVLFTAQPGLDYYYQWSPLAYFGAGDDASGLSRWGRIRAAGYAYLTVTDRWGCQATDSVLMRTKSCCEVFLPNAFTPNGDGSNDVFRMVTSGNQDISTFIIVNRYGRIVFETANQAEGWDGTYRGEAQDIGTYQYYLKYKCADNNELIEMKGDVILLR